MQKTEALVAVMAFAMMTAVLLPISLAFARRIFNKTPAPPPHRMSAELDERLHRMEQAIESIAIEVERVGEGQRFVTQLLANAPARSPARSLAESASGGERLEERK